MSGEWYDISTDGTFVNGIFYPGNDNAWWNRPVTDALMGNQDPTLEQSEYDFKYRVFPENLTSSDMGHYMVININVPTSGGAQRGANFSGISQTVLGGEFSKVDVLRFSSEATPGGGAQQRQGLEMPRSTRRIAESIALHMPNPIVYNSQHVYEEVSMTAVAGNLGIMAGQFLGGVVGGIGGALGAGALGEMLSGSNVMGTGQSLGTVSRMVGYPINPRIEVLYATTPQRQFSFEVLMAPRTPKESETIKEIVKTLRFHSAPELSSILGIVPTFIAPAEFDITFYNKGVENTNIPRINTCFLERIEVDYAPTGTYSTFTNGHPVTVRLSMGFREIEILHKLRVAQGF